MSFDEQFSLQVAAGNVADKFSDLGVLLALVLVALVALTVRLFRRLRADVAVDTADVNETAV